ncbi:MAG TPA: RIO1 family regulatory kinase/ATPase [Actinomycetes bacterium]|nr:RIO1 family regulatory kinase/ATPase [Actinomycetes bacterium]
MEPTAGRPPLGLGEPAAGRPQRLSRAGQRRRPSGEAPPLPRALNRSGRLWLTAAGAVLLLWAGIVANQRTFALVLDIDHTVVEWFAGIRTALLTDVLQTVHVLGSRWTIRALFWSTVVALVLLRRFRHLFVFLGATLTVTALTGLFAYLFAFPRPLGVVILGDWSGYAHPSRPVAALTAVLMGMLYSLAPEGRLRRLGKPVIVALIAAQSVALLYLGVNTPSDVLIAAVIGVTIPLVAFRMITPNEVFPVTYHRGSSAHLDIGGRRGQAIHRALEDQLGVQVAEIKPFGLSGSAGSTPMRVRVKGEAETWLFAKLYAGSHLRSDRWYKLGRTLLYGRLEDEKPFNTVRRLVQQEAYALRLMHGAGVRSPEPFGIVEITPEREYLVVTEFFDDAQELGDLDQVDDGIIDDGLRIIRRLWDAGLAHRDIKPANLLVRDGRVHLIDVFFAEVRPSPWRQAVDLANMMLVLACRSGPEQVYRRARLQFNDDEIAEAFAATSGITMPSQLRRTMRDQGRDLHAEFTRLLPTPPPPIRIQRWSLRRIGLLAVAAVLVVFIVQTIAGSIASNEANATPLYISNVACTDLEPLWLEAQSVPSASMVPCVRFLPVGWTVSKVTVNDGQSVLTLSHDRAGYAALVVQLTAACTPSGAVQGPSQTTGVRHYQRIESRTGEFAVTWYDQFPGGCATSQLRLMTDPNGEFAGQAPHVLGFRTRAELEQALSERSDGRLQLDPEEAR